MGRTRTHNEDPTAVPSAAQFLQHRPAPPSSAQLRPAPPTPSRHHTYIHRAPVLAPLPIPTPASDVLAPDHAATGFATSTANGRHIPSSKKARGSLPDSAMSLLMYASPSARDVPIGGVDAGAVAPNGSM